MTAQVIPLFPRLAAAAPPAALPPPRHIGQVGITLTGHAKPNPPPRQLHYDPPSLGHILRPLLAMIGRSPRGVHVHPFAGDVVMRGPQHEGYPPLAYIDGAPYLAVALALAELQRGRP